MPDDAYKAAADERDKHTSAVLGSESQKRVVVAGPGTGKTFLFKQVLKEKPKSVTLTFINALVDDLSLELFGQSEVKTLHGFARGILGDSAEIFAKLPKVIFKDAQILLGADIDFEKIISSKDDANPHIEFYSKRRKFYGKYFGFTDIVYALTKYYEKNPEKVPTFQQVVIDEFQDFNKLEVSLVEILATKSPILIAGDDDQALYDFKQAKPDYIRDKHGPKEPDYEAFNLPFCSRCPRVVVEATNDIVQNAIKAGLLNGRIDKPYVYFDDKKKDELSAKYPQIVYTKKFDSQLLWYIENEIEEIAKDLKKDFTVLIISPIKSQCIKIGKKFAAKGIEKVEFPNEKEDELTLVDGLSLLIEDTHSSLGWRIISQFLLEEEPLRALLVSTDVETPPTIESLLPQKMVRDVRRKVRILRRIKATTEVTEDELKEVVEFLGCNPFELAKESIQTDLLLADKSVKKCNPAIKKIPIKATTVQGSKGLAADYVFITHFDDQYFLEDKGGLCDKDIYKFLVALTRAKSKAYLISTIPDKECSLLNLVAEDKIQQV